MSGSKSALVLGAGMLLVLALGWASYRSGGLPTWRFQSSAAHIEELTALFQDESRKWTDPELTTQCFQLPEPFVVPTEDFFVKQGCLTRRAGKRAVMLLGDSHSASLGVGLRQWARTQDMDFLQASGFLDPRLYCVNQEGRKNLRACAADYTHAVMKTLAAAKPDVLVLDMYWSHPETMGGYPSMDAWVEQIQRAVNAIAADLDVKKIIIVGQVPTWQDELPHVLLNRFVKKHRPIPERSFEAIDPSSLAMEKKLKEVTWPQDTQYFSVQDFLCNADGCMTRVGDDWRTDVLVWDYGHLTEAGSRYVVAHGLQQRITEALKP